MSATPDPIGHALAQRTLRELYRKDGPHTLLLAGPEGVGRRPLALWLAALLNCQAPDGDRRPCGTCPSCRALADDTHPDVREIGPSETTRSGRQRRRPEITIDQLVTRQGGDADPLGPWLERRPRFTRRVGIIDRAETLNVNAANAFLKVLEEPPPWALIALVATGPDALLPTVASRCTTVRLGAVDVGAFADMEGHPGLRLGLPGPLMRARADEEGFRSARAAVDTLMAALDGELLDALNAATALAAALEGSPPIGPLELLREALRSLPAGAYAAALDALEHCEEALAAYVSAPLALTTLALDLRGIVRAARSATTLRSVSG